MKYTMKDPTVDAVFWDGVDRDSIYAFFEPFFEPEYGAEWRQYIRFTADEESGEEYDNYNMVKWSGCGGPEVGPGRWIVTIMDLEFGGREWDDWPNRAFRATFTEMVE